VFGWSEPIGRAGERFAHRIQDGCNALAAWRTLLTSDMIVRGADMTLRTARRIPARLQRELVKLQPFATLPDRIGGRIRRSLRRLESGRLNRKIRRIPQKTASLLRRVPQMWELIGPLVGMTPQSPGKRRLTRMRRLHTNGCGDFTLLTRDDWFRLRGYPEWPIFSWHIDSVLMFAASANDIAQVALDAGHRIYHIDHSTGSGWSHDGATQLFARLDRNGVPYIGNDFVLAKQLQFAENPELTIVNREDWGFDTYALADREVVPAGSHAAGATRNRDAFAQPLPAINLRAAR
jgi:hypothetical protein